jgi:hypothetical protein
MEMMLTAASLVSFLALILGWIALPHSPASEKTAPAQAQPAPSQSPTGSLRGRSSHRADVLPRPPLRGLAASIGSSHWRDVLKL